MFRLRWRELMRGTTTVRLAVVVAAACLQGCYWGAEAPLMPAGQADPSPIAPGEYRDSVLGQSYATAVSLSAPSDGTQAAQIISMYGRANARLSYDRIDANWFLAEARYTEGGSQFLSSTLKPGHSAYALLKPTAEGFEHIQLHCDKVRTRQSDAATKAGATLQSVPFPRDRIYCKFAAYDQVLQSAREVLRLPEPYITRFRRHTEAVAVPWSRPRSVTNLGAPASWPSDRSCPLSIWLPSDSGQRCSEQRNTTSGLSVTAGAIRCADQSRGRTCVRVELINLDKNSWWTGDVTVDDGTESSTFRRYRVEKVRAVNAYFSAASPGPIRVILNPYRF